ncbi:serine/arginine repetitive matrix protein 1-like [Uloborus diversus]|uniref:serine/arginine repetitive matrix protein 1-like n=1 Tax=Uloborus diversus TaxID=327109 RepID=UPI0024098AD4|nr:serine/arginine repetitive matrix protein 1-like [Uloborus diversus]
MRESLKPPMKSRKSPPMGKGPPLKKSSHSRSPYRVLGSSRPVKHPVQKRPPSPPVRMRRVSMTPPPRRPPMSHRSSNPSSPVSMDRLRSVKRPKFEKRKPSPPRGDFGRISPYPDKYSRPHSPPHFQPPIKKMHREEDHHYRSPSPQRVAPRSAPPPHRRREEAPYEPHPRSRPSSSKGVVSEVGTKRYRDESPERYAGDKSYAPTLHERFSDSSRTDEPRIRYSTQDLEKITIDIHRNLREDRSPTLRRILDPSDVKLVRRAGEGHRPIFDREEIRRAPRDLREDAHFERRVSQHARGEENYEITRHRFDPRGGGPSPPARAARSLSDRWQDPEGRKDASGMDREDRDLDYDRGPPVRSFRPRPDSGADPDYRSDKYSAQAPPRPRPSYPPSHHRPQERDVVPIPRKEVGARHHVRAPSDDGRPHYRPERRYSGPKVERSTQDWDRSREEYPRRSEEYSSLPAPPGRRGVTDPPTGAPTMT